MLVEIVRLEEARDHISGVQEATLHVNVLRRLGNGREVAPAAQVDPDLAELDVREGRDEVLERILQQLVVQGDEDDLANERANERTNARTSERASERTSVRVGA